MKEKNKTVFEGKKPIGVDPEGNEIYFFDAKEPIKTHSNYPIRGYVVEKYKDKKKVKI